jgi:DNA polymerase elongation subunit (family B)
MIEYKTCKTSQAESEFTNPPIGGLITSYGRMKLYDTLHQLQEKVLYYDTDSVMFKEGKNIQDSVKVAPYLGELESELKPEDYIDRFASLGCKSYAYTSTQGKKVVKAKGFTLKGQTSINIDSISNILKNKQEARLNKKCVENSCINIEQFNIRRVKTQQALYNTIDNKSFKFTFDKRRVNWEDFTSLPYGHL